LVIVSRGFHESFQKFLQEQAAQEATG
jgi:hypothetical protein